MYGIDTQILNNMISKLQDIKENSVTNNIGIENSFEILSESYYGDDIETILRRPSRSHIKFSIMVDNYIDVLENVIVSYVKQNQIISEQLSHINLEK